MNEGETVKWLKYLWRSLNKEMLSILKFSFV